VDAVCKSDHQQQRRDDGRHEVERDTGCGDGPECPDHRDRRGHDRNQYAASRPEGQPRNRHGNQNRQRKRVADIVEHETRRFRLGIEAAGYPRSGVAAFFLDHLLDRLHEPAGDEFALRKVAQVNRENGCASILRDEATGVDRIREHVAPQQFASYFVLGEDLQEWRDLEFVTGGAQIQRRCETDDVVDGWKRFDPAGHALHAREIRRREDVVGSEGDQDGFVAAE
jgi:hypothetical protein